MHNAHVAFIFLLPSSYLFFAKAVKAVSHPPPSPAFYLSLDNGWLWTRVAVDTVQ
jgi:hypothetical protein